MRDLHDDGSPHALVERAVDAAHAAPPQGLLDAVAAVEARTEERVDGARGHRRAPGSALAHRNPQSLLATSGPEEERKEERITPPKIQLAPRRAAHGVWSHPSRASTPVACPGGSFLGERP